MGLLVEEEVEGGCAPFYLSSHQLSLFNSQGYLVVESFATQEEIETLKNRMFKMVDDDLDPSTISHILSQQATTDYLFQSVEKASFFFEAKAIDKQGNLVLPKELSLSKVAHGLHEIDPTFKKYTTSDKVKSILSSLGYNTPVIIQSVYVFKQPGIGGEVAPHQDSTFLYTEPVTCTGLWLALEDATLANGCLHAIPGSHKNGLGRRLYRDEKGVHYDKETAPAYDDKDFVPIQVKAGSLVLIHGLVVHRSYANTSSKSRQAYTIHALDTHGCIWPQHNWIQRKMEAEPLYTS